MSGVQMGYVFQCTFGTSPLAPIIVRPITVIASTGAVMNISDMLFSPSAGCTSPSNPQYAPPIMMITTCVPLFASWAPPSAQVTIGGVPALTVASVLTCTYAAGVIKPVPTMPFPIIPS